MRWRLLAWASAASAALAFTACLTGWLLGGGSVDWPWAPAIDARLDFALDGLGALYSLLATGIGAVVFAYATSYLPRHLEHGHRPLRESARFWPWMVFFMGSMVGLACARDLLLLFVFFDLTAIASYFLIGFDRDERNARSAALMALLVTGVSAVCLLIGSVLLFAHHGTFELPLLFERVGSGTTTTVAAALIAIAALAKSAQVPLHYWLPRAMAAPTPVSAYLHSAAMVAAGVLVLGRVHPLLARSELVLDALLAIGFASIAIGGVLALAQDELKQVLAHSTISQYGYVVMLYGIGGAEAAGAAALYAIAHAIAKSALFMTAGAVTEATGETRLSRLGGLARGMPVLAVASGAAAATLVALPLTLGFFKDELFFAAARDKAGWTAVLAVVAAALTFAYVGRFWLGLFRGPCRTPPRPIPALLVAPVGLLAAVAIFGGIVVEPFANLANAAGEVTENGPVHVAPAYHLDLSAPNAMALAAWALGLLLLAVPRVRDRAAALLGAAGDRVGPRRAYRVSLRALNLVSDRMHGMEVRDLRNSIAAVFVPSGVLIAVGFGATPTAGAYVAGHVALSDLPIVALLGLAVVGALALARDRGHVRMALGLSVVGFALAGVYELVGAPGVALVAVLIETIITLVFLVVLARLPRSPEGRRVGMRAPGERRRARNAVVGVLAGLGAFVTIWGALSRPTLAPGDAAADLRLAPSAHGTNVVTVILADFRGLDTLAEITVLTIAVAGIAALARRGRLW